MGVAPAQVQRHENDGAGEHGDRVRVEALEEELRAQGIRHAGRVPEAVVGLVQEAVIVVLVLLELVAVVVAIVVEIAVCLFHSDISLIRNTIFIDHHLPDRVREEHSLPDHRIVGRRRDEEAGREVSERQKQVTHGC